VYTATDLQWGTAVLFIVLICSVCDIRTPESYTSTGTAVTHKVLLMWIFCFLRLMRICDFKEIINISLHCIYNYYHMSCGPGSSVGIATGYGLDGPGIESRWGRDFPPVQTSPGTHPAFCTMGTRPFSEVKSGRGVLLTTHPLLAPRSWKSIAIPLPPSGPQPGL